MLSIIHISWFGWADIYWNLMMMRKMDHCLKGRYPSKRWFLCLKNLVNEFKLFIAVYESQVLCNIMKLAFNVPYVNFLCHIIIFISYSSQLLKMLRLSVIPSIPVNFYLTCPSIVWNYSSLGKKFFYQEMKYSEKKRKKRKEKGMIIRTYHMWYV